jgi:hypothetical protein
LKTADGNGNQSIESMGKYENPSKQKFKKSACIDLGNRCSIHLSYGGSRCSIALSRKIAFFTRLSFPKRPQSRSSGVSGHSRTTVR